jgi:hypothetical protein
MTSGRWKNELPSSALAGGSCGRLLWAGYRVASSGRAISPELLGAGRLVAAAVDVTAEIGVLAMDGIDPVARRIHGPPQPHPSRCRRLNLSQ